MKNGKVGLNVVVLLWMALLVTGCEKVEPTYTNGENETVKADDESGNQKSWNF